jgi:cyclopropane-fatty-acyl-phospholipid synthase
MYLLMQAGKVAASGFLGQKLALLENPRHMELSLLETGACFLVTRFLQQYVSIGTLM